MRQDIKAASPPRSALRLRWRPGQVMQLPLADELVLVSGIHPILATKARYYEDRRLQERILPPPSLADLVKKLPKAPNDDWSALVPVVVDPKPAAAGSSDEDPDNAGIPREPALPGHEAIAPESPQLADSFAILVDEADDEPAQSGCSTALPASSGARWHKPWSRISPK